MLRGLRKLGLTSDMMYAAGLGSIGLSILSWYVSKNKENAGLDRADGPLGTVHRRVGANLLRAGGRATARRGVQPGGARHRADPDYHLVG